MSVIRLSCLVLCCECLITQAHSFQLVVADSRLNLLPVSDLVFEPIFPIIQNNAREWKQRLMSNFQWRAENCRCPGPTPNKLLDLDSLSVPAIVLFSILIFRSDADFSGCLGPPPSSPTSPPFCVLLLPFLCSFLCRTVSLQSPDISMLKVRREGWYSLFSTDSVLLNAV